jgi:hypothetical protein
VREGREREREREPGPTLSAWGERAESRGEASSVDDSQFRLIRSRDI